MDQKDQAMFQQLFQFLRRGVRPVTQARKRKTTGPPSNCEQAGPPVDGLAGESVPVLREHLQMAEEIR
jgi:hypothetical protein